MCVCGVVCVSVCVMCVLCGVVCVSVCVMCVLCGVVCVVWCVLCVCVWCGVCVCVSVCGLCVCMCMCVCLCACVSVRLFRNHEFSRNEYFKTLSVGDDYLIIMLPQILLRNTL